jgi:hypothetical protein
MRVRVWKVTSGTFAPSFNGVVHSFGNDIVVVAAALNAAAAGALLMANRIDFVARTEPNTFIIIVIVDRLLGRRRLFVVLAGRADVRGGGGSSKILHGFSVHLSTIESN